MLCWGSHLANMQTPTTTHKAICVRFLCQYNVVLTCVPSVSLQNSQNKLLGDLKSSFIPLQIHKHYSLFSSLPQIACLAFLSFQYPLLLFKGLKGTEKNNATEVSFDLSAVPLASLLHGGCTTLIALIMISSLRSRKPELLKKKNLTKTHISSESWHVRNLYKPPANQGAYRAHTV